MKRRLAAAGVLLAALAAPLAAPAEPNVIVARSAPDVVLVWRVNDAVRPLFSTRPSERTLRDALAGQAVGVLRRNVPADAPAAARATVKLVYFNSGGYDANYRIATVSGVRRVGEITAGVSELRRSGARWQSDLERGREPRALQIRYEAAAFDGLDAAP